MGTGTDALYCKVVPDFLRCSLQNPHKLVVTSCLVFVRSTLRSLLLLLTLFPMAALAFGCCMLFVCFRVRVVSRLLSPFSVRCVLLFSSLRQGQADRVFYETLLKQRPER